MFKEPCKLKQRIHTTGAVHKLTQARGGRGVSKNLTEADVGGGGVTPYLTSPDMGGGGVRRRRTSEKFDVAKSEIKGKKFKKIYFILYTDFEAWSVDILTINHCIGTNV